MRAEEVTVGTVFRVSASVVLTLLSHHQPVMTVTVWAPPSQRAGCAVASTALQRRMPLLGTGG